MLSNPFDFIRWNPPSPPPDAAAHVSRSCVVACTGNIRPARNRHIDVFVQFLSDLICRVLNKDGAEEDRHQQERSWVRLVLQTLSSVLRGLPTSRDVKTFWWKYSKFIRNPLNFSNFSLYSTNVIASSVEEWKASVFASAEESPSFRIFQHFKLVIRRKTCYFLF